MGLDMTFLKDRWKALLAGVLLGALLGSGIAGFAVYKSQEAGRKALAEVGKTAADIAACNASLKEATANADNSKALHERAKVEALEFKKQLDEQKEEIEKLTSNLKKAAAKPGAKTSSTQTAARTSNPIYINRPAPPQAIRKSWEDGL